MKLGDAVESFFPKPKDVLWIQEMMEKGIGVRGEVVEFRPNGLVVIKQYQTGRLLYFPKDELTILTSDNGND